jgi:hypothetical protein
MPSAMQQALIGSSALKSNVLIDRTLGTNIGDLTAGGGLAAAFDGVTNQALAACATKVASTDAYIGKTLAAPRAFGQAIVYGSNDAGFYNGTTSVTITVFGKQGAAPANSLDGTALGTTGSFTDTADESAGRTITSTNTSTLWDHLWVRISNASGTVYVAELQLFAWE